MDLSLRCLLFILLLACSVSLQAQTESLFLPEIDTYVNLNPTVDCFSLPALPGIVTHVIFKESLV
jgi:hypothetical protein